MLLAASLLPALASAQDPRILTHRIKRQIIEAGRNGATGGAMIGAGFGLGTGARYGGLLGAAYGTVFGAVGGGAYGYLVADAWAHDRYVPKSKRDLMPTMKVPPPPNQVKK